MMKQPRFQKAYTSIENVAYVWLNRASIPSLDKVLKLSRSKRRVLLFVRFRSIESNHAASASLGKQTSEDPLIE